MSIFDSIKTITAAQTWLVAEGLEVASGIFASHASPFLEFAGKFGDEHRPIFTDDFHEIVEIATTLDSSISGLRDDMVNALKKLIGLGNTIQGWISLHPAVPESDAKLAEFEQQQQRACSACEGAQRVVAGANNRFVPLTRLAQDYDTAITREQNRIRDAMQARERSTQYDIDNRSPPWQVYAGGVVGWGIWMLAEEQRLKSDLDDALRLMREQMEWLQHQREIVPQFEAQLVSWKDMTASVSSRLGATYNILSAMWGQLLEDPTLYQQLLDTEWQEIVRNASATIELLQGGTSKA